MSQLVSRGKPASGSGEPGHSYVTDGSLTTAWNSGAGQPQEIEIDLGEGYTIEKLEVIVNQNPDGNTRHIVDGINLTGQHMRLGELSRHTRHREEYTIPTDQNVHKIRRVKVETVQSPSSVGWFEIKVYALHKCEDECPD